MYDLEPRQLNTYKKYLLNLNSRDLCEIQETSTSESFCCLQQENDFPNRTISKYMNYTL